MVLISHDMTLLLSYLFSGIWQDTVECYWKVSFKASLSKA